VNTATPHYTASQLARALDKDVRAIRRKLESVPPSSLPVINGNETKAWALESLAPDIRAALAVAVHEKKFRDEITMFSAPPAPAWQPAFPLAEVAAPCRRAAQKLQRALTPSIARREDVNLSAHEFERRGLNDYAGVFGDRISDRHWRALLKRTLERDGGREDWNRLEIYLAGHAQRAAITPAKTVPAVVPEFPTLSAVPIADTASPTWKEIDLLWQAAIETFDALLESTARPGPLKRALCESVMRRADGVARNANSARVIFDTKYKAWLAAGKSFTAIADKRHREQRPKVEPSPELLARAERVAFLAGNNHGGKLAPAFRVLIREGIETATGSERKSYVPKPLRQLAAQDALIVAAAVKNERALRSMVPTLSCDPSRYKVHDIFTYDDVTLPILWYVPDGAGWFNIVQGQCLVGADWRSWRVLQFSLQPDAQYNSKVIRTLFAKTFAAHGLPKELKLEGGMWRSARLIHGNDAQRKAVEDAGLEYTHGDVIHGLQTQLGLKITHAITPTGKTQIESIFRLMQDYLWGDKGYCGRDQRTDLPDKIKRQKYQVEHRQAHPSEFFYSFPQLEERLHQVFTQYNAAPQDGDWLKNESPDEAFEKYQNREDPPIAFDARCRHLLACQVSIRHLKTDHTIRFEIGREKFCYFSPPLMALPAGARVMIHFDPELPECITVTDLNRQNPITIPRSLRTYTTDDPVTQNELGKKSACASYLRARFRTLEAKYKIMVRTPLVSADTAELGAQIESQRAELAAQKKEAGKTQRLAAKAGVRLSPVARRAAETPAALKSLTEFLNGDEP